MSPTTRVRPAHGRATPAGARALGATLALAVVIAAGAILALTSSAAGEQPISVPVPPPAAPLASGPVPELDLLFTSQVAGWVEPCG